MLSSKGLVFVPGATAPIRAKLRADGGALHARSQDGREFSIPFPALSLESDAEAQTVLYRARDSGLLFSSDERGVFESVAAHVRASQPEPVDRVSAAFRKRARKTGLLAGLLVGVALSVLGALWFAQVVLIPRAVDAMPTSVDLALGQAGFTEMRQRLEIVENRPESRAALEAIVGRLGEKASRQDFSYQVFLARTPVVNAFALPGGIVVVHTGLLCRATRPDEVAGVLGHELAHVTYRHGLRGLVARAGLKLSLMLLLGDVLSAKLLLVSLSADLVLQKNSRDQEREADVEGARMAAAAGFDPHALAGFFQQLSMMPGAQASEGLAWLSSHPGHAERIGRINALSASLPRGAPASLPVSWDAVRAECEPGDTRDPQ